MQLLAQRSLSRAVNMLQHNSLSVGTAAWSKSGRSNSSFSTLVSSFSHPFSKQDDENERKKGIHPFTQKQCQARLYQATNRNEIILPFVPEMILFVFFAGGWTVYRLSQGKPLTPDEALRVQEEFRKHQARLMQQHEQRQLKRLESRQAEHVRD
mmetsp:Transcript_22280/g.40480  ORF Transcript_22280/g.40480 Transcript_22280/m.40480 type:complete len:154 (+) Transcript_22280:490-951(+)